MSIVDAILDAEQELQTMRDESESRSERGRANILLVLAQSGLSQRGVARVLGHAPSHVHETVRRFREDGVEGLRERRGRSPRLPRYDEIIALLPELVANSPRDYGWNRSTWSVELVALEVERQLGVRVSRTHMGRLLLKTGCRRIRPKPTVALAPDDHADQIAALDAELAAIGADDVVLYEDEVDIHLNPKVGADWMPPGVRKELVTPGKNRKHYVAGAYDPATETLFIADGPSKNSALFIQLLEELAAKFKYRGTVHLVLDNYIIHKSKITQKAVSKLNGKIKLHFLPAYCPDYNPIERVWWDLHNHVTRNHQHPDLEALMTHVRSYVAAYATGGVRAAAVSRIAA